MCMRRASHSHVRNELPTLIVVRIAVPGLPDGALACLASGLLWHLLLRLARLPRLLAAHLPPLHARRAHAARCAGLAAHLALPLGLPAAHLSLGLHHHSSPCLRPDPTQLQRGRGGIHVMQQSPGTAGGLRPGEQRVCQAHPRCWANRSGRKKGCQQEKEQLLRPRTI